MSAHSQDVHDLVAAFRRAPDEANTIAACRALATSEDPKLVDEVGRGAALTFASTPTVLIEVARMYLGSSRLGDAQALLVSAGKMAPKNAATYRWLGEVLLRRGDAERAAKVMDRALLLGLADEDTMFWHQQAHAFGDTQRAGGAQGVIAALSSILVATGRPPIRPSSRPSPQSSAPVRRRTPPPPTPPLPPHRDEEPSDPDAVTMIRKPSGGPPVAGGAEPDELDAETAPRYAVPPFPFALDGPGAASAGPITVPPPSRHDPEPAPLPRPPSAPRDQPSRPRPPITKAQPRTTATPAPPSSPAARAHVPPAPPSAPPARRQPLAPVDEEESTVSARINGASALAAGAPAPAVGEVLSALAAAGVHDARAGATAHWDAPPKVRSRFVLGVVLITALLLTTGVGVLKYVAHVRAQKANEARRLGDEVSALLDGGSVVDLGRAEDLLSRAFELDPNSPRTTLLWVRDRVLRPFEVDAESQGIDSAMSRARQTGVPESDLAFARVASFLGQGDTAGAAALLPQWDGPAKDDAYYQLFAGAALERAGDLRAIERYRLAVERNPKLVPAQIMLSRALLLEGDFDQGLEVASRLRASLEGRPEPAALAALAWARRLPRGPAPPELDAALARRDALPTALGAIPGAVDALKAGQRSALPDATAALERALTSANTPALATWLGSLALEMHDDAVARRAALQAVSFSAVYPQARVLAARVALAGGRLDEALAAVAGLDATSPDVAIVRATVAYERLDVDAVTLALEAVPSPARQRPELAALSRSADVMRGGGALDAAKLRALASPAIAWGEMIALDAALDAGNVAVAKDLLDAVRDVTERTPVTLRRARYQRYTEHLDSADTLSVQALTYPTVRSTIERLLLLIALERRDEARALVAKQAAVLGPMASWMIQYVDAKGQRGAEARAKAALLEVPGVGTPLGYRVIAALALAELRDTKRGPELARALGKSFPQNPDVRAALRRR